MNTKFVYLIAGLALGMSSFAVARENGNRRAHRLTQNHYATSTAHSGFLSEHLDLCKAAKDEMEGKPNTKEGCSKPGEFGEPKNVTLDSDCSCYDNEATGKHDCYFGVSWDCSYDNDGESR